MSGTLAETQHSVTATNLMKKERPLFLPQVGLHVNKSNLVTSWLSGRSTQGPTAATAATDSVLTFFVFHALNVNCFFPLIEKYPMSLGFKGRLHRRRSRCRWRRHRRCHVYSRQTPSAWKGGENENQAQRKLLIKWDKFIKGESLRRSRSHRSCFHLISAFEQIKRNSESLRPQKQQPWLLVGSKISDHFEARISNLLRFGGSVGRASFKGPGSVQLYWLTWVRTLAAA